MIQPEDRWEPGEVGAYISGGPERVVADDPAPAGWKPPRLLGFSAGRAVEPLLWDGDQA